MAISFGNRIKEFLQRYVPIDTNKIRETLPFVWTLGYEKAYGKPHPQDFHSMIAGYKSWAYACAWKNATSVAKCELRLYKQSIDENGDEQLDRISEHPFLDVLKAVNPFSNRFELLTITQINLELTGNGYWWIPRNQLGVPYMIWNIPSHWMRIIPDPDKFVAGYVAQIPYKGTFVPFDETEIVHFKFPSPFDLFYGTGPFHAARYGVDLNDQVKTWGINFFMNNAQPSGVLTTDSSLSTEQYQRLKDRWNQKYRGSQNAGKIAVLEAGLKYQQTGSSVKDARIEMVTQEVRDEIMAMFGVPASKLGLSEHTNRANADTNDYTYQKETITPRLTLFEEKLNEKMIPIYDKGLVCRFETPIQEDENTKATQRAANIGCGFISIDEARIDEGLEPYDLPETRVPLIPFNLVPAGQPKPQMDANGNPAGAPQGKTIDTKARIQKWETFVHTTAPQEKLYAGVVKRFFESQHSEVIRKLNARKAVTKDLYSSILFNQGEQTDKFKLISKPNIHTAISAGLAIGAKETNSTIDFTLFNPQIMRMTEARASFVAEKINASTAQLLKDALDTGLAAGESIADIGKRIDNIYSFSEDFRSKRIAQTEIIGATNEGQLKAYAEAGVEQTEWLTAGDERVRDSHAIMDGQEVEMHQAFTSGLGSKLLYPGDRTHGAPPEDVINCRCTIIPVIKL